MHLSVENVLEAQEGFQPLSVEPLSVEPQFSRIQVDVNKIADLIDQTTTLIFPNCYVAASP